MNRQRAAGNGIAVIPPVPSDYRSAAMSRFIL
ncbi:DNA methylase, partial [Klebsiella michiganensis]